MRKKNIIIEPPDPHPSKCISLPQLFLHSHIFSWMHGVDFILSGLLYSFNLQWSGVLLKWEMNCVGSAGRVEAAPAEPDGVRVYLEVSGRWCDCSPMILYGVMDVCLAFSEPAAYAALIFKTKEEEISGVVWLLRGVQSLSEKKLLCWPLATFWHSHRSHFVLDDKLPRWSLFYILGE